MTDGANNMVPDASPGGNTGVRRINSRPMYIVVGVAAAFVAVMAMVAVERSNRDQGGDKKPELAGSTDRFAKQVIGENTGAVVPALTPPVLPEAPTNPPVNLNAPPLPPRDQVPTDEEAHRIRLSKLQMLEEAARAKTVVNMEAPRSAGSAPTNPEGRAETLARLAAMRQQLDASARRDRDDPTAAYQKRLAQLQAPTDGQGQDGAAGTGAPTLVQAAAAGSQGYSQYGAGAAAGDRWRLDSRPEPPRTPYELRAGFVVPAMLISGINSDLPGQIMAQVAQDVFDTATGRYMLIPQGSRLVGTYSNEVAYGQSRVLIAWQRIVFPDGKAMDIGAMPGSDEAGYAGFADQVNHHFMRVFGSAVLMSAVVAGVSMSQNNTQSIYGRQRASDALSESLGQQIGMVTAQMIAKNLNIAPTIEIRPGYRFNVIVTKDMTFSKPYQSFDY